MIAALFYDNMESISTTFYKQLLRRYSFLQSQTVIREKLRKTL